MGSCSLIYWILYIFMNLFPQQSPKMNDNKWYVGRNCGHNLFCFIFPKSKWADFIEINMEWSKIKSRKLPYEWRNTIHLFSNGYTCIDSVQNKSMLSTWFLEINVRKHQRGNQERTIQLNRQHWVHTYEDKQNKNTTQYVLDTNIRQLTQITEIETRGWYRELKVKI